MIYVDGTAFSTDSSSSQEIDGLILLMEHPFLVSVSHSFRAISERKFSIDEESNMERSSSKCVYVFQREYATVDPALVDTCVHTHTHECCARAHTHTGKGYSSHALDKLIPEILEKQCFRTSIAHMDSPDVVDIGLTQMLSSLVNHNPDEVFDVHLVGGFLDASPKYVKRGTKSQSHTKLDGYSFSLCTKIIEALQKSNIIFHIQTLHVLGHNTRWESEENAYPIFHGLLVEPSTGLMFPASFDRTSRCPDEIVRRIRLTVSFQDPSCAGMLMETYDTQTDQFTIAPFSWSLRQLSVAYTFRHLSDTEILLTCSSSPLAEGPDFVDNQRRQNEYLIEHPDWRKTFPSKQPRVFERTATGGWRRR